MAGKVSCVLFLVGLTLVVADELIVKTIKEPKNCPRQAKKGDQLQVHYVIQGYEQGVPGMCKGETRVFVVPPHLGYGENGVRNVIPGGATLHFTVELMNIADDPAKSVLGAAVGGALLGAAGALALSKIARGRNNRGRNNFRSRSRFGGRRYGKYRRYGRALPDNLGFPEDAIESTAKMDRAFEYLYLASQMDKDTCVRRLICHVNDPKVQDFQQDGTTDMFAQVFGADEFGKLDFGSPLVDLDLAAEIGLQIGAEQCGVVYSRCEKSVPEILREMGEAEKILLQDETFLREQNLLASSE
ncbi:hypothetical protein TCAL_03426 [Tigriopus californicus]|uniref:peptidylprolyl isomerase n=1 Tax=Tigriopus californicus TaxID=6832 RepID=A0A553P3P8_TIGCA|nr:hypothetical protein TCAL_03426 [Tigriopus californicus]|eukprot:TCALIF_03426-PA protein Name:"Similar to FKBP3 FK506-binding protein 2B (Rhizopus delemar (strain RA 99-880 / ATCC MYA-4621 / FGSC 9543 / NRRL 43880))" AED:0.12 eAED:0.12 QI:0/0.33/0.5/1/0.66/0.75/4/161/299